VVLGESGSKIEKRQGWRWGVEGREGRRTGRVEI
jgi:hypothetical protein